MTTKQWCYGTQIMKLRAGVCLLACLTAPLAFAEDEQTMPPPVVEGEELQPEVRIIKEENKTTYEYSINGHVYMVKIVPTSGPAYYLRDLNGDGQFDEQTDDVGPPVVPQWVLLRW